MGWGPSGREHRTHRNQQSRLHLWMPVLGNQGPAERTAPCPVAANSTSQTAVVAPWNGSWVCELDCVWGLSSLT